MLEQGNDITQIKEIAPDGLFTDDVPTFEYVEAFVDGDQGTFKLVYQLDDSRTVAVIALQSCFDADLLKALQNHSAQPQPLPTLERRAL